MRLWTRVLEQVSAEIFHVARNVCTIPTTFFVAGTDDRWFRVFTVNRSGNDHANFTGRLPVAESYCGILYHGRDSILVIDDSAADSRVSSLQVTVDAQIGSYLGARIDVDSVGMFGTLCAIHTHPYPFVDAEVQTISALARILGHTLTIEYKANTDPLTGLFNRAYLEALLDDTGSLLEPEVSVVVLDIDDFKLVNDGQGHTAGDGALRRFAEELTNHFSVDDHLIRLGGDEFCVISADPLPILERRYHRLATTLRCGEQLPIGFSGGFVRVPTEELEVGLKRADEALYHAKRNGKGMFVGERT